MDQDNENDKLQLAPPMTEEERQEAIRELIETAHLVEKKAQAVAAAKGCRVEDLSPQWIRMLLRRPHLLESFKEPSSQG